MAKPTMPGQRYDIGGSSLHAQTSGDGSPAVILEPALGAFGYQWLHIQKALAEVTRVVSYDRAGQGWSDPSPYKRTPEQVTNELHLLLEKIDLAPPYILVGHSFGGLLARYYAQKYAADVSALVLVDASPVDQYEIIPNFNRLLRMQRVAVNLLGALSHIGFFGRAFAARSLAEVKEDMSPEEWDTLVYLASRPNHHYTVVREFDEFERYFGPTSEIPRDLGDLPLTVITAGSSLLNGRAIGGLTPEMLNDAHLKWQQQMAETLSSQGQQYLIQGASHLSIVASRQYAAQVSDKIAEMVAALRG